MKEELTKEELTIVEKDLNFLLEKVFVVILNKRLWIFSLGLWAVTNLVGYSLGELKFIEPLDFRFAFSCFLAIMPLFYVLYYEEK